MKTENEIFQQVRIEKTALLYRENRQGLLMSLLVGTLVCGVLATQVGFIKPLVWWLCISTVLLGRMLLFVRFQTSAKLSHENVDYWHKLFVVGALAYGAVWGFAAPYFAGQVSFELMVLTVMIMISLCVGAVPYLFYSMVAVEGYLVTIITPIAVWLYFQGSLTYVMTGVVCTVFALSTYLMARKLNLLMTNAMRLQLENASLSNELIKANYELKTLSSTDPLSGIANRRAFEKEFEKALAQCRRDQGDISVLMFDIDHFKRFNDSYGHLAGDKLIHLVAQTIKRSLKRPSDMAARYGGEEFIVMLPATDLEGAVTVANDIREQASGMNIDEYAEPGKRITLSAGVTTLQAQEGLELQNFVHYADKALYEAKGAGRNCTMVQLPDQDVIGPADEAPESAS